MLNSNLAEAWRCSGWMKNWLGDPKLAIEHFARAMRLIPTALITDSRPCSGGD
jgi:adenylate cyclase